MMGNAGSDRVHEHLGMTEGHHYLSHHQGDPAKIAALEVIAQWELTVLAGLLERLAEVPEPTTANPDATLLDHTVVLFTSECADGDSHSHFDLPALLAGGPPGLFAQGQHLAYSGNEPIADLYLALLQGFGAPQPSFGSDGMGPLPGVLVGS